MHTGGATVNVLRMEKRLAVVTALVEGNSIRSTERMTGVHRDTIMRVLVDVGENCRALMDQKMRNLSCRNVEVDEVWTFVRKKQLRLRAAEKLDRTIGDQYTFVAIDADTKLIPCFEVGKRDGETTERFISGLQGRLARRIQLTADGFGPYVEAVEHAWGANVDFAQLVKVYEAENPGPGRYSPPKVQEVVSTVINGNPDPARVCTSYVERQNLTIRMACRRFTRLTNAFSKKLDNLKAVLALHFAYYNFVRVHRTLRVTPAMAAGVSDRVWRLGEVIGVP